MNTIDFTAVPLPKKIQNDNMNIWSLHTRGLDDQLGQLFDFICLSKEDDLKYRAYLEKEKKHCVLECNFNREASGRGLEILNRLKKKYDMDCEFTEENDELTVK